MIIDRKQLTDHYETSRRALLEVIAGLSDERLGERSLDGWSVNDHLAHLAFWDDLRADEVERIAAGHQSACRMTPEQDEAFNDMGHDLRRHISSAQARWELETSRRRLLEAIAAAPEPALETELYGEAGLRTDHEAEHVEWIRRWRLERGY